MAIDWLDEGTWPGCETFFAHIKNFLQSVYTLGFFCVDNKVRSLLVFSLRSTRAQWF